MSAIHNQMPAISLPMNSVETEKESEDDAIRAKRRMTIIDKKLEDFINVVQKTKIQNETLCIEVEELKATRESLKLDLPQTLSQEMARIAPRLTQDLKHAIHQQMTESLKTNLDQIQKIQREAEDAVSTIKMLVAQNKKRFIHWGLSLVAVVCFSCLVIASGLFYFFPQQHNIRYEINHEQAKQMLFGKYFLSNFRKLKPEDQKLLSSAIEDAIVQKEGNDPVKRGD